MKHLGLTFVAVVLAAFSSPSPAIADEIKDTLPAPPAGKAWKLAWNDEFDGEKLDETKWAIPPDAPRRDAWWMRQAISLDGGGNLAIATLKDGRSIRRRLRSHAGPLRTHLRLLRRPDSTPRAARPLVRILADGAGCRQNRR